MYLSEYIQRTVKGFFIRACVLLLLSALGYEAKAEGWELKRNSSGIRIYTQSQSGSEIRRLKADFEVSGTVSQLASLLADVGKQKSWVYSTRSAIIIRHLASNEFIYYTEKNMPWPLTNRDVVMHTKCVLDTAAGTLTVISRSTENVVPEKNGLVRVPASEVRWNVYTTRPGIMKVEYSAQADPGGTVPAWVTNMFLTKGPYETFMNLRKQMNTL